MEVESKAEREDTWVIEINGVFEAMADSVSILLRLGDAELVELRVSPGVMDRVCVYFPDSVIECSTDGDPSLVCEKIGLCEDSIFVLVGETDVLNVPAVVKEGVTLDITLNDTTAEFEFVALIVGNVAVADTEVLVDPE